MNPLHSPPIFFSRSSPDLFEDVEMLQTDVMRFFAILCLCLTAIFALVKALPVAPPDATPTLVEPADLKAKAESLQKKIATLKEKLFEMQTRVLAAAAAAKHASVEAVKATKAEESVLARVARAKQELAKVSQTLADTRREIEVRESKLTRIVGDIAGKRRVQAELKSQIENETQNLEKIRVKVESIQEKLDQNFQNSQKIFEKPPVEEPLPEPAPKGFTLRFVSDDALAALISEGAVKFYAIAGKKTWRLILSSGKPVYIATEFPRQIYEMETPTVPAGYAAAFQRQVAAFGRDTLTWGVTLPGRTTDSINLLANSRKGGDLIITADGEVNLN